MRSKRSFIILLATVLPLDAVGAQAGIAEEAVQLARRVLIAADHAPPVYTRGVMEAIRRAFRRSNEIRTLADLAGAGRAIPVKTIRENRAIVESDLAPRFKIDLIEIADKAKTGVDIIQAAYCSGLKKTLTDAQQPSTYDYITFMAAAGMKSPLFGWERESAVRVVEAAKKLSATQTDVRSKTLFNEARYRAYIGYVCKLTDGLKF